MNAAIVDTDVVSMFFKGDTRALAFRPHVTGRLLGISFMTLAELERWPLERRWGSARKGDLAQHLAQYIQTADAWIAASALFRYLSLRTTCRTLQWLRG